MEAARFEVLFEIKLDYVWAQACEQWMEISIQNPFWKWINRIKNVQSYLNSCVIYS